ncbi:NFACT family protein [Candidatus Woesearchaeota archaeon]|nr:NFACT family protein [Candidatus Woesearchaeota archaeon]
MKTSISSIELACLVKEFQSLIDGKVNKIWLLEKELVIQLHIPNLGKKFLRIRSPDVVYLTDYKPETPEKPHGFCLFLRKYLDNARIRAINQVDFERILEIVLEKKEGKYHLFTELFVPSNFILTDDKNIIMSALETKKWKDREIIKGKPYEYPKLKYNFLKLKKEELKELVSSTDKENIVKALAMDLGLGGIYSEELLGRANLDKSKKELNDKEINALFKEIEHMRKLEIRPFIVEGKDVVPFDLICFKDKAKQEFKNYNEALDKTLTEHNVTKKHQENEKETTKHISKEERIILMQEENIERLKKLIEENQQKGEAIYHNYQLIDEILKELNKAKQKYSWKEIGEKLKGHKIIKRINEKEKTAVIEIE